MTDESEQERPHKPKVKCDINRECGDATFTVEPLRLESTSTRVKKVLCTPHYGLYIRYTNLGHEIFIDSMGRFVLKDGKLVTGFDQRTSAPM